MLDEINRLTNVNIFEEKPREIEDRTIKTIWNETQRERKKLNQNKQSIHELWDNVKWLCVSSIPERGRESILWHNGCKFPDLTDTAHGQIQEAQQIPSMRKMKKTSVRHNIIKFLKVKDES